jgi:intergrase/recombinase
LDPGYRLGKSDKIDYEAIKTEFTAWMRSRCSEGHVKSMVSYLNRYVLKPITTPEELFKLINNVERGKREVCMAIRDILKYCDTFQLMNEDSIARFRKVIKLPQTNADLFIPSDDQVISAFRSITDERYITFYKLLVFSGLRLREAIFMLNTFDSSKLQVNGNLTRYPLNLVRGTKRVYYAFMPTTFAQQLRKVEMTEPGAQVYLIKRGIAPKYLRKWQYNFLILNSVPESVADFIQGRAPSTVGSMHYLAKVKQADEWYRKVVPNLLNILS